MLISTSLSPLASRTRAEKTPSKPVPTPDAATGSSTRSYGAGWRTLIGGNPLMRNLLSKRRRYRAIRHTPEGVAANRWGNPLHVRARVIDEPMQLAAAARPHRCRWLHRTLTAKSAHAVPEGGPAYCCAGHPTS